MNISNFIAELFDNFPLYFFLFLFICVLYFWLFKKRIWGIFDPLCITIISMAGASTSICILWLSSSIEIKFLLSFLFTELALILGILWGSKFYKKNNQFQNKGMSNNNIADIQLFVLFTGFIATILQVYSFYKFGIILFHIEGSEYNHATIYANSAFFFTFLNAFRILFIFSFFYCFQFYRKSTHIINYLFFGIVFVGVSTTGSKSSILMPIIAYFTINYYGFINGKSKKIKIPIYLIMLSIIFPIFVITITSNTSIVESLKLFYLRIILSGDILIMGYNEAVMESLREKSFLKYIFYPGFGSIFKNIGWDIQPPINLGDDVILFYYGKNIAWTPNVRINFFLLHFLGFYFSICASFFIGIVIGKVRQLLYHVDQYFFKILASLILYTIILETISDIYLVLTHLFWIFISFGLSMVFVKYCTIISISKEKN